MLARKHSRSREWATFCSKSIERRAENCLLGLAEWKLLGPGSQRFRWRGGRESVQDRRGGKKLETTNIDKPLKTFCCKGEQKNGSIAVEEVVPSSASGQVRSYYVDWKMLRDVKRRKMAYEYVDERLHIHSLRKNTILPKDLQEVADEEIAALPRDSCCVRITNRCLTTSRPRGVRRRWRLSHIFFSHLADHGQLSGVQQAMW